VKHGGWRAAASISGDDLMVVVDGRALRLHRAGR
jgi:hypothetical protein